MLNSNISSAKLMLTPFVIKRFDKDLGLYIFYNTKDKLFWETDYTTGSIISALDGSMEADEIFKILSENSGTPLNEVSQYFSEIFASLLQKDFIYAKN